MKFSVRGRDLASTIAEAQRKIAEQVKLPYDTHLEWAGEINQLNEATGRLALIIPITLLVIAMLVYSSVKNWRDMLIVLGGIPVACCGGILALLITRTNFSISAAMGFISIFGIAVQDALIVVTYAQRMWDEGHGLEEGARIAAERRLVRLMTTFVAMLGLTPGGAVARHRRRYTEAAGDRRHRWRADPGDSPSTPSAPVAGAGTRARAALDAAL